MAFDAKDLETIISIGGKGDSPYSSKDAIMANKVLNIIKNKQLLVVTLLLGNTAVNAALSIFLSGLVGAGLIAGIISTFLIVIFGEIIPVVLISRFSLLIGSKVSFFVLFLIKIFYPISFFIVKGLQSFEKLFGDEIVYSLSRKEIVHNIECLEKDKSSDIDAFDSSLVKGSLSLAHTNVKDVMTLRKDVFFLEKNTVITKDILNNIINSGYTRIPIFETSNQINFVGVFNVKTLIGIDPIGKKIKHFISNKTLFFSPNDTCDDVIIQMISSKTHIATVYDEFDFRGIITLEDVIEEILNREIIDEYDKETLLHK